MKLRNSTDFSDRFVRRMISWCATMAELPPSKIRAAQFTTTRAAYRGRAWRSMRVLVRIGDAKHFPINGKYPGLVRAPEYVLADRIEAIVHITAHEIEHLYDYREGIKITREAQVDFRALKILEAFRDNRDALLAEWNAPTKTDLAPEKPKISAAEKREAKAISDLERWEKRLRLAKTKVSKYRARVRYYEQKQAATSSPSDEPSRSSPPSREQPQPIPPPAGKQAPAN